MLESTSSRVQSELLSLIATLVLKLLDVDRSRLDLQFLDQVLRKSVVDDVPADLPLNPSIADLTEPLDSVLDISQRANSRVPAIRIIEVEQHRHKRVKCLELDLEFLQHGLVRESAFSDDSKHELAMFVAKPLTGDRDHELEERPNRLTLMTLIEMMHRAQYLDEVVGLALPPVVHLEFFEEVLGHLAQRILADGLFAEV